MQWLGLNNKAKSNANYFRNSKKKKWRHRQDKSCPKKNVVDPFANFGRSKILCIWEFFSNNFFNKRQNNERKKLPMQNTNYVKDIENAKLYFIAFKA